jgi:hypothetical protein
MKFRIRGICQVSGYIDIDAVSPEDALRKLREGDLGEITQEVDDLLGFEPDADAVPKALGICGRCGARPPTHQCGKCRALLCDPCRRLHGGVCPFCGAWRQEVR